MIRYTILLLLTVLHFSCDSIWMEEEPMEDKIEMFESMWEEIDENYVFFDQKEVDWELVKSEYSSMIQSDMNDEEFFDILSNVLSELQDGHVSLFAGFNTWNYYDLFLNYPSNFNWSFIQRNYLIEINTIGSFVYGILDDDIGYLYYESFGDNFTNEEVDYLLNTYFKHTKGLIIDVRDNLGGAADNVTQLMSAFVTEEYLAGKTFTPDLEGTLLEDEVYVEKAEDIDTYTKPIVILTNRSCYSSCNVFVGFMSQLENVTIVGDTTGGGSGLAVASELANGWKFRYSGAKITLADDTEIENGVEPDINVITGPQDELDGIDAVIEEALELF